MKLRTFVRPEAQTDIREAARWYEVRRALLHKFPYSIYFVNEPEAIAIIAVLHQHRRPDMWKSRA